jgi:hypothetical protein
MSYKINLMPTWGLILSLLSIFIYPHPARAAEEFDLNYTSVYEAVSDDTVAVSHQIDLTNRTSAIYATSFSFDVGLTDITDIAIKDRLGIITPVIDKKPNSTHIQFDFNDQVAGKNKTNYFTIEYRSKDILTKNGAVWELNIPKLAAEHRRSTFDVTLIVPVKFGKPAFISPTPKSQSELEGKYIYVFDQFSSAEPGITALFGTAQYLSFDLAYHLENPVGDEAKTKIAIPPDTSYQKIYLKSIDPEPDNIEVDADGNWLASFKIAPKSNQLVKVTGIAKMSFTPTSSNISPDQKEIYTKPTEYWQTDSETISSLAQKLKSPVNIYQYVTDHLGYNYAKIDQAPQRFGALKALENPEYAICTEFADLTVALLRGSDVPTRELEGYAFSLNDKLRPLSLTQDVLHAWVEYYDESKSAWVQIDPTWGQTTGGIDYFSKLDLNHFVFVVHGTSSTDPSPAGAYKDKTNPGKDVLVSATTAVPEPAPNLVFEIPPNYNPSSPKILVKNRGQSSASLDLSLVSSDTKTINTVVPISSLPPFGSKEVEVPVNFRFTLRPTPIMLNISDGTKSDSLTIDYQKPLTPASRLAVFAGCLILLSTAIYAGSLRLRRRGRSVSLHW